MIQSGVAGSYALVNCVGFSSSTVSKSADS